MTVALSRVPTSSMPATTRAMKIAGRLTMPPASGPASSASGIGPARLRGSGPRHSPTSPPRPRCRPAVYSRIRLQPTTQAISSPSIDVGVGVGAAGRGHHRRHLGVAERRARRRPRRPRRRTGSPPARPGPRPRRSGCRCRCRRSRRRPAPPGAASPASASGGGRPRRGPASTGLRRVTKLMGIPRQNRRHHWPAPPGLPSLGAGRAIASLAALSPEPPCAAF